MLVLLLRFLLGGMTLGCLIWLQEYDVRNLFELSNVGLPWYPEHPELNPTGATYPCI